MHRTHTCGDLRENHAGKKAALSGWVDTRRDHGGLTFIDIRDRYGITQLVLNPEKHKHVHELGKQLRREFTIQAGGIVRKRPKGTNNMEWKTGAIEVEVSTLKILSPSMPLPIEISDANQSSEETSLKYRYLDLRGEKLQRFITSRHRITKIVRDFYNENGFLEIETPILAKSTPEGARDYLVPSRIHSGKFYALPQSPQIFKQLLMVAGFDRYFQIARCFRDEDLRADRQPEFTQIDVEMSFVEEEDVFTVHEKLMQRLFKDFLGISIKAPFPRLSYGEAVSRFGLDKPDMRFGLELVDLTKELGGSDFNVFKNAAAGGGLIKAIRVPGKDFSRTELKELEDFAKIYKAKGLAALKTMGEGTLEGQVAKFLSGGTVKKVIAKTGAKKGDFMLIVAGPEKIVHDSLGYLRNHLAQKLGLAKTGQWNFLWVTGFPMFEWDNDEQKLNAMHHPFTSPREEDLPMLEKEPLKAKANAYDLVLNGSEIGGGSIRIHSPELQARVFKALGISDEAARDKFGFMLEALRYGAPPHGGIALGMDRIIALLVGTDSIRDVIAFPKNKAAASLMDGSPSKVDDKQLRELHLRAEPEHKK